MHHEPGAVPAAASKLPPTLAVLPCPVAVIAARDGRIEAANPAWLAMAQGRGIGRPGGALAGLFPDIVLPGEPAAAQTARQELAAAPAHAPPAWFGVELVRHPDAPSMLIAVAQDVTGAVLARGAAGVAFSRIDAARALQAEMQRRAALENQLLHVQKLEAVGHLVGSVAQDFRSALAAVDSSLKLITRHDVPEPVRGLAAHGQGAVRRAESLFEQLTRFTRQAPAAPEVLDLRVALPDLEDVLRHTVRDRAVCCFDIAGDAWPVIADAGELGIAVLNLAANSRDAMHDGGIITISARNLPGPGAPCGLAPGDYVAVTVTDHGEGMAPEIRRRAGEAFFSTKPPAQGAGLGLHMVDQFARRCGGALHIESTPGSGTAANIILPRAAVKTSTDAHLRAVRRISAPAFGLHGGAAILLVQRNAQARALTADFLRELGYDVAEAAGAEAALVLWHQLPEWGLLITDLRLAAAEAPGGEALAAQLRGLQPGLPVLYMTGEPGQTDIGQDAVLAKPFSDTLLARMVLRQLGRAVSVNLEADPLHARLHGSKLQAVLRAWHQARACGEGFPPPGTPCPADFGLAENAFAVAIELSAAPRFRFEYVGAALVAALRQAQAGDAGADAGEAPADPEASGEAVFGTLEGAYRRCARTRAPVYQCARYDFGDGRQAVFERLLLPASLDGVNVTHLTGVVLVDAAAPAALP
jgi:signal transduction histidine kinase